MNGGIVAVTYTHYTGVWLLCVAFRLQARLKCYCKILTWRSHRILSCLMNLHESFAVL